MVADINKTKLILHGGHFGGEEVWVEDPKQIIEKTDDSGKVWLYDFSCSENPKEAVYVGMKP